jgi:hypothetical protein
MSAEIIAELRERADRWDADTYDECWEVKETPTGKSLRAAAARLDELERENAALREALKPFAAMADNWSQNFNDTQGFSTMPLPNYRAGDMQFQAEYTMGDLRRARAAADKIRAALEHDKGEGL